MLAVHDWFEILEALDGISGTGVSALLLVLCYWFIKKVGLRLAENMNRQIEMTVRNTAAIEEANGRSCEQHERMCSQLEKQNDALITLNAEIQARNSH